MAKYRIIFYHDITYVHFFYELSINDCVPNIRLFIPKITANDVIIAEQEGHIALLTIYDKSDYATVDVKVIRHMAREMGFGM